jgi:hypothetical protein
MRQGKSARWSSSASAKMQFKFKSLNALGFQEIPPEMIEIAQTFQKA